MNRSRIYGDAVRASLDLIPYLAFLLAAVILFHGKPVPFSNEFLYLSRLEPDFLIHDWTFQSPANEHWLFNLVFTFPVLIFSSEAVAWFGRVTFWVLSLAGLIRTGRFWGIAYWQIATATFFWLAFGQAALNGEWLFGGFEAKVVAYCLLIFSLVGFSKRRIIAPSILLGLAFAFHPAVGLWAIPAVIFALIAEKTALVDIGKAVLVSFVFSLPGLLPLVADQVGGAPGTFEDWRLIVLYRMPYHLDAFQFSKSGIVLVVMMLGFNWYVIRRDSNFALRFLLKFQIALGAFFFAGIILRSLEIFPLLRFMPMRLFPVFTPLFFIFSAFYYAERLSSFKRKAAVSLFAALVVAAQNPFRVAYVQASETITAWQAAPDSFTVTSRWIANNLPPDAVVIQPPHRRDFWYHTRRAAVASFAYPPYDRLTEWRERLSDLTGGADLLNSDLSPETMEAAYNRLSHEQIDRLKIKYGATHLVSRTEYSYPIHYESEDYKVYRLP